MHKLRASCNLWNLSHFLRHFSLIALDLAGKAPLPETFININAEYLNKNGELHK